RMLREYTLFIDPPAVPVAPTIRRSEDRQPAQAEAPSDPAAAPPSVADGEPLPEPEIEPEPEPEPQTEPQPQEPVPSEAREAAASAVVVERGDTLWSIAADWRPDASLTMNQAMLAIFDRNPEAFIGSNVNRLRRGARLNLPGAEDARAIPAAEAARRFREQIQAWEAGQTPPVAESPEPIEEVEPEPSAAEADSATTEPESAVPEVAEPEETVEAEPELQPRLELAPPEEDLVAEAAAIDVERQRLSGQLSE
ncbi:MAG: FimV/HubP family polar landmark protein, partial [Desulfosalsimonas sp.]